MFNAFTNTLERSQSHRWANACHFFCSYLNTYDSHCAKNSTLAARRRIRFGRYAISQQWWKKDATKDKQPMRNVCFCFGSNITLFAIWSMKCVLKDDLTRLFHAYEPNFMKCNTTWVAFISPNFIIFRPKSKSFACIQSVANIMMSHTVWMEWMLRFVEPQMFDKWGLACYYKFYVFKQEQNGDDCRLE